MKTTFKTKSIISGKGAAFKVTEITYHGTHNDGSKTLDFKVILEKEEDFNQISFYKLELGELPKGLNEESALDKLSDWMMRAAQAIKDRKLPIENIIIY